MAQSFNNTVPSSFGGVPTSTFNPKKKVAPIDFAAYKPTTGLVQPQVKTAAPAAQPTPAPVQQSYKGLVQPNAATLEHLKSGLMNVQSGLDVLKQREAQPFSTKNPDVYGNIVTSLAERSTTPSASTAEAQKAYQEAVKRKAVFEQGVSDVRAANQMNPIPLEFRQGRDQVIQQANAEKLSALQGAITEAQAGIGLGQTQQQIEQAALTGAAGLVPEALRYGGFGQTGGGTGGLSGLNPLNNVDMIAQQVANGQLDPRVALSMGGQIPNWQGFLNQKISALKPDFNWASAQGQFDARQQSTTIAGTAPTQAFSGAYQQFYPQSIELQTQLANVEGLGGLLLTTAQGGQINPFDPQLANRTVAQIRGQLSSPEQAKFNSTLAAFQGAASQLLASSSGQIPTDVSANIAAISNGSLSMGALRAMVEQAEIEGRIKLQSIQSAVNTAGSGIGAPRVGGGMIAPTGGGGGYADYISSIGK